MNNEKKNQIILISVIVSLMIVVIVGAIFLFLNGKDEKLLNVKINQIYNSDYDLHILDNNNYFGTYDNKINVFIDDHGKEIIKTDDLIAYDGFYKMQDGKYLFYNNVDNKLNTYVFDGLTFKLYFSIEDVSYVKPIINNGYIIGFTSFVDEKLYLYNLENDGINVLNDTTLLADKFSENVFYTNSKINLVIKNKDGKYCAVNIKGEYVIECIYNDLISLDNDTFIVKDDKDKYGIINKDGEELVEFKYDGIIPYSDYYVMIKGNKMALFDYEYNNLTGFVMNYNSLLGFNYRGDLSIKIYNSLDDIIIVNNSDEDRFKREYQYHNAYVVKNNKVVKTIDQIGFDFSEKLIYSFDEKYNIKIYDKSFEVVNEFELDDVYKIEDLKYYNFETIKIEYVNDKDKKFSEIYSLDGKRVKKTNEEIFSNNLYYGIYKDGKLEVLDYKNNVLAAVDGNLIDVNLDCIIMDKILYKIVIE